MKTRRVFFDIETEGFSFEFSRAESHEKQAHAPTLIVAVVYDEQTRRYTTYFKNDFLKLIRHLELADEVISFNGKNFDVLVIRKLHPKFRLRQHIDLCEEVFKLAGYGISLDLLARENLGHGKLFKGIDLPTLPIRQIIRGCRSDVSQTFRLYRLWKKGTLRIPANSREVLKDIFGDGIKRLGFASQEIERRRLNVPTTRFFRLDSKELQRAVEKASSERWCSDSTYCWCSVSDLKNWLDVAILKIQNASWTGGKRIQAVLNPFFCSRMFQQPLPTQFECLGFELINLVRHGMLKDFKVSYALLPAKYAPLKKQSRELLVKHASQSETLFRTLERINRVQAFFFATQLRGKLLASTLLKVGPFELTKAQAQSLIRCKGLF